MFGSNKNTSQPSNQIPYEVYQTVNEPTARRRRLLIRLGASLLVVTLLVFGTVQLGRFLYNRNNPANSSGAPAGDKSAEKSNNNPTTETPKNDGTTNANGSNNGTASNNTVTQSPQQNSPLPSTGSSDDAAAQANNTTNNSTVHKPE
jgi:hypothetical protein